MRYALFSQGKQITQFLSAKDVLLFNSDGLASICYQNEKGEKIDTYELMKIVYG